MPQLGEGVAEGTITRWIKRVGENVAVDDVLFEVTTDKVDSEFPSPISGNLAEILVPEGETVAVGTLLAIVSEDVTTSQPNDEQKSHQSAIGAVGLDASPTPVVAQARVGTDPPGHSPLLRRLLEESQVDPSAIVRTGAGGRITRTDIVEAIQSRSTTPGLAPEHTDNTSREHSPVVRRLLATFELEPSTIVGTGAGGRITRTDVLKAAGKYSDADLTEPISNGARVPYESSGEHSPSSRSPESMAFAAVDRLHDDEILPFSNIRRRTAEHMVRSKSTSAHTTVAIEVDYFNVDRTRMKWKETFRKDEGFNLTYLPFATRAAIDAIGEFPQINSSVGDDALVVHRRINVGIAVDLEFDGLLVPVIKQADSLRLRAVAREISTLSGKARKRRLLAEDLSAGTFTITNAGPFGTLFTVPVINQPQVAILSTDSVKKRPVAIELPDGSDGIAVHPVGNLAMSWDHRAFDGAYAAAFLKLVKDILETRDWGAEL